MTIESLIACVRPTIVRRDARPFDVEAGGLVDELNNVLQLMQPRSNEPAPETGSASCLSKLDESLNLVHRAAEAAAAVEDRSNRIQAKALEVMERAREDLGTAHQQVANIQSRLSESEARASELSARLAEAEDRAIIAHDWLRRVQDTISKSFTARCAGRPTNADAMSAS
jgi:hypothetical protein